ncbi:hypothetical protein ABTD49_22300, partial [Acinetobacter baumannii]
MGDLVIRCTGLLSPPAMAARGHQWRTGRAQLATDGDTRGPAVLSRLVDRTLVAALGRRARV